MHVGAVAHSNAFFGGGTIPILLDNVNCIGTESTLLDCQNHEIGINYCGHHEDAGVECTCKTFL